MIKNVDGHENKTFDGKKTKDGKDETEKKENENVVGVFEVVRYIYFCITIITSTSDTILKH